MKRSQCGVTLIEILIALAVATIITTSLATLFAQSVKSREQVDKDGQRIETGRYALEALADDLRLAGFWGDYSPPSTTTWTTADPCATTLATLGWNNAAAPTLPVPIMGFEAHPSATPAVSSSTATATCLPNYKTGTDVLVIRRLSTKTYAPSAIKASPSSTETQQGDVYMQSMQCRPDQAATTTRFIVSDGATANFTMQQVDCATASPVRRVFVRIYYVATCNECTTAETPAIPTLKYVELAYSGGSLQRVVSTVAPGVESIHFEYGVDSSGSDGSTDSYQLSDADGLGTGFNWQDVMAVKAYVLTRDLATTSGYTNNRQYPLGSITIAAQNDSYKRNVFSSTIRLVNQSGRRETP